MEIPTNKGFWFFADYRKVRQVFPRNMGKFIFANHKQPRGVHFCRPVKCNQQADSIFDQHQPSNLSGIPTSSKQTNNQATRRGAFLPSDRSTIQPTTFLAKRQEWAVWGFGDAVEIRFVTIFYIAGFGWYGYNMTTIMKL